MSVLLCTQIVYCSSLIFKNDKYTSFALGSRVQRNGCVGLPNRLCSLKRASKFLTLFYGRIYLHIVHDLASFMASLNCWCYSLGWVMLCSFGASETAVHIPVEILRSNAPIRNIGTAIISCLECINFVIIGSYITILQYNHLPFFPKQTTRTIAINHRITEIPNVSYKLIFTKMSGQFYPFMNLRHRNKSKHGTNNGL